MTLKSFPSDGHNGCLPSLVLMSGPGSCEGVLKNKTIIWRDDLQPVRWLQNRAPGDRKAPFSPWHTAWVLLKQGAVIMFCFLGVLLRQTVSSLVENPSPGECGCFCSCWEGASRCPVRQHEDRSLQACRRDHVAFNMGPMYSWVP